MQGRVRSWMVASDGSLLVASMAHNRWCACIQRAHASNGIYYVVDLQVTLRPQSSVLPGLHATPPLAYCLLLPIRLLAGRLGP